MRATTAMLANDLGIMFVLLTILPLRVLSTGALLPCRSSISLDVSSGPFARLPISAPRLLSSRLALVTR